jgi:hypothetical protein
MTPDNGTSTITTPDRVRTPPPGVVYVTVMSRSGERSFEQEDGDQDGDHSGRDRDAGRE